MSENKSVRINTGKCLWKMIPISENDFSELIENIIANKILLKDKYGAEMQQVNDKTDYMTDDIIKNLENNKDD